jgi:hypothetical protein
MRLTENLLRRTCGVALLLAVALSLTACGGAGEPEDEQESNVPSSTSPPPPPTPPTSTPASSPQAPTTSLPPSKRGEVTVRGVIQPGVEPGCLLLDGDGGPYLLLGGQQELRAGAEVVVRGRLEPDTMTICQQGVPLQISEVRPA